MSHVIGGNVHGCQMNGQFYLDGEVINNDGNECVCINGDWQCNIITITTTISIVSVIATVLDEEKYTEKMTCNPGHQNSCGLCTP